MLSRVAGTVAIAVALAVAGASAEGQGRDSAGRSRAALEGQLRQRIAVMVKERLELTDAQATQLQYAERRFEVRRRALMQREQRLRLDLRQQLAPGFAADQQRVASLLEQIMAVHRERAAMAWQEQRDLARFLTPVQRAKYLGLQGELRRRIERMRQGGPAQRPPPRRQRL